MMKLIPGILFFLIAVSAIGQDQDITYEEQIMHYRMENQEDLVKGDRHPLEAGDLKYLDYYSIDPNWKLHCRFKKIKKGKKIDIPTYSGIKKPFRVFGRLSFKINGKKHTLLLYQSLRNLSHPVYKDYLFLPFKDWTNGDETYGGGRYIDVRISDLDGKSFDLDFNRSYNPWCAYSDGFNCPVPPIENHLELAVRAGEKGFRKDK